jgi:hypothetical protein
MISPVPSGVDDCQPVLRLGIANCVPTGQQGARGADLRVGRGEDLGQHLQRQLLGKGRDREGQQRGSAHREDVVEGVRRRDRAVVARVVHDRREEVEREDQGTLVVEAVDGGVVGRREPDEQVLGLGGHEAGE